jgi:hypothetical protein
MASGSGRPKIDWSGAEKDVILAVAAAMVGLPTINVKGTVFRAVFAKYLLPEDGSPPKPLYYEGSLSGRRYTPRNGPAGLYLGLDPSTLPAELRIVVFEHGLPVSTQEHDPVLLVSVRANVSRILDLTNPWIRQELGVTEEMLLAEWESVMDAYLRGDGPMPRTQLLAQVAHLTELFAGIRYPSARTEFGQNLVLFPDRLEAASGDHLEVVDSTHRFDQHLPP